MPDVNLPRCPRCAANDWPYAPNGGVQRCDCPRGRPLAHRDRNRGRPRSDVPGITCEQAAIAVERLAGRMLMVPASDLAHAEIAGELQAMVCEPAELEWLVAEAPLLYREWPGFRELRALYCAKCRPRDGVLSDSVVYKDSMIPGVTEPLPLIADSPRGGAISANADDALLVRVLADVKQLDAPRPEPPQPRKPPQPAKPRAR